MQIRAERLHDYAAIAAVEARAFKGNTSVAMIVALHRHRAAFDPDLSLVAEIDGQIVGHVLFSPQTIRLLGEDVRAVNLSPLAVDPAYQRQGIGGALIRAGHEIAQGKGYALSFLLGHPWYYPRFGYQTGVYGVSSIEVSTADLRGLPPLETRKPTESDIPALRDLWRHEEGNVDFAIDPGGAYLDWVSPNPAVEALVYLREGRIVGFTRTSEKTPSSPRVFLAADHDAARSMAARLGVTTLLLHPYSASASAFGVPTANGWDAGMACPLAPSPYDEFITRLRNGERLPGRPVWGVEFELE